MAELGNIQKPTVESFAGKRKLYCVPNIYMVEDSEDYKSLFNRYWDEVSQQIDKIESAGRIKKIFCEIINSGGEEALSFISKINEPLCGIIRRKIEAGAVIMPLEEKEIFGAYMDWGNCLRVITSKIVFEKVYSFFSEFSNKRFENMLGIIDKNLLPEEAGLLILKDDDRTKLQFPKDMEVFLVTPPSYDDILKWMREKYKSNRASDA